MVRRRLSDITNSLPQHKSPENFPLDDASAKEYIDHLVKEKMALVKLIQEKNKIIELSGIEIQNLRTCLQKMQLQNWNLAQSNSHMLAELNMGKERLKALHHEVACKEALLKTKKSQMKWGKKDTVFMLTDSSYSLGLKEPELVTSVTMRYAALGSSSISHQHAEKEAVISFINQNIVISCVRSLTSIGNFLRRCLRRQSASSRIRHEEPTDNLFEIDDAKFPIVLPSNAPTHEAGPEFLTSPAGGVLTDGISVSKLEVEARRTSIGRPSRRAAEKIQSYKERPINVKMRRSG
ncbi:hypothetical protein DH2020_021173 [Rehmannia glutinosa]|uniref:Shugoshin C-terminal domain-containing protein n=1 Tax=Rehmannia glutinosa TaxID=99300 RepID=A0ABR0W9M6_REHGL